MTIQGGTKSQPQLDKTVSIISQDSVATCSRHGGICNDDFVSNLVLNESKKFY